MIREKIEELLKEFIGKDVKLERPNQSGFGDFSTNAALKYGIKPENIIGRLKNNPLFEKVEKAGPGFINFILSKKCLTDELKKILEQDKDYGQSDIDRGKKVQIEFISANPTGPLTVANARGGPYGDVLANVLKKAGFKTEKAYYVNDTGNQILALGHSVLGDEKAEYRGKYIEELRKGIKGDNPQKVGLLAADKILAGIKRTAQKLGIEYDEWISELELYKSGWVDKALAVLKKNDFVYEKDRALWFKAKKFGDSRDRVLIKKDKAKTYLAGDAGLHYYKFRKKGFDKVINVWGPDHHGDVAGLLGVVEALGYKGKLEIVLYQFVTLLQGGQKKKMSKRAGVYVSMDELLDEAGKDAVRFFFLQKSNNTHLNFDLDLAKEESAKNPVYYVQYAYARICSILDQARDKKQTTENPALSRPTELNLLRKLIQLPEIVEDTAKDYQTQRLPNYALEIANSFHKFYETCRVIDRNSKVDKNRIALVKASRIVLRNLLDLMGISAPEKI